MIGKQDHIKYNFVQWVVLESIIEMKLKSRSESLSIFSRQKLIKINLTLVFSL